MVEQVQVLGQDILQYEHQVVLVENTELQELQPLVEVVLLKQLELQILEAVVVDMIIL